MDWLQTRRVGRPRTGKNPPIRAAIPRVLLKRIDASASDHFESRNDTIRRLLEAGLKSEKDASRD